MSTPEAIEEFERDYEWASRLYRSLGRFIVRFEWLSHWLENAICDLASADSSVAPGPMRVVLGNQQPKDLLHRYQALLAAQAWVRPSERKVIDNVCKRIERLIEGRNRAVHGLWFDDVKTPDGAAIGTKFRHTAKGLRRMDWKLTPEQIEALGDEADALAALVGVIASAESYDSVLDEYLVWDENGDVRRRPGAFLT